MTEPDPPLQAQPEAKDRGPLVAALALGALLAVFGTCVWILPPNPEQPKPIEVNDEMVPTGQEARFPPGTAEVRALGCSDAFAVDLEDFKRAMQPDSDLPRLDPQQKWLAVICQVTAGDGPSCSDVADAYFKAVPRAAGKVAASVLRKGEKTFLCHELYSETGRFIVELPHKISSRVAP